jgi:N-acetylneuraminate lyase
MKTHERLQGLIAASFTPMDRQGNVCLPEIAPYAEFLIKTGVNGVFVNGTTGEGASLTTDERRTILEHWVKAVNGRIKVIAHVGGFCLPDAVDLASHAQQCGADGFAAIAPSFFKPGSVNDLIRFFIPIAAAAPELPFYYYNMPSMTGVDLSVEKFLTEGKKSMPNLAGTKFTHNNLMEMGACLHLQDGAFEVLNGFDEMLIAGMAMGATAGVGSTYNYFAPVYNQIIEAMKANKVEEARANQLKSIDLVKVIIKYGGGVRGGKAIMNLLNIHCGPCRLPIAPFSDEEYASLKKDLDAIDFFQIH